MTRAGAFDEFNPNRAQVLAGVEAILGVAGRTVEDREQGQNDLFGGSDAAEDRLALPAVEAWLPMERLTNEFDAVGFFLSGHPLDEYMAPLKRSGVTTWQELAAKIKARRVTAGRLAGTVSYRQERRSKNGNRFAFAGFSDPSGQFETIIFSETLAQSRDLLEPGRAVIVSVEADVDGEEIKLRAQAIETAQRRLGQDSVRFENLPAGHESHRQHRDSVEKRWFISG